MVITLNKQIISKLTLLIIVIAAASCSSVRVTNESVVEEGVRGVTISPKKLLKPKQSLQMQLFILSTIPQD